MKCINVEKIYLNRFFLRQHIYLNVCHFLTLSSVQLWPPARSCAAGSETLHGCRAEGPQTYTQALPAYCGCWPPKGWADEIPGVCLRVYWYWYLLQKFFFSQTPVLLWCSLLFADHITFRTLCAEYRGEVVNIFYMKLQSKLAFSDFKSSHRRDSKRIFSFFIVNLEFLFSQLRAVQCSKHSSFVGSFLGKKLKQNGFLYFAGVHTSPCDWGEDEPESCTAVQGSYVGWGVAQWYP